MTKKLLNPSYRSLLAAELLSIDTYENHSVMVFLVILNILFLTLILIIVASTNSMSSVQVNPAAPLLGSSCWSSLSYYSDFWTSYQLDHEISDLSIAKPAWFYPGVYLDGIFAQPEAKPVESQLPERTIVQHLLAYLLPALYL